MSSSPFQPPPDATVPIRGLAPGAGSADRDEGADLAQTTQLRLADLDREAAATDDRRAAIDALPATSALLVVDRGSFGARFLLDAERTTAGRHPASDIFLDDTTVSRRHAVFERRGAEYWLQDEGSLNGTYVNGVRVDSARLDPEAQIQIGKFRMTFHPSPSASQREAAVAAGTGSGSGRPAVDPRPVPAPDAAAPAPAAGRQRRRGFWARLLARVADVLSRRD